MSFENVDDADDTDDGLDINTTYGYVRNYVDVSKKQPIKQINTSIDSEPVTINKSIDSEPVKVGFLIT